MSRHTLLALKTAMPGRSLRLAAVDYTLLRSQPAGCRLDLVIVTVLVVHAPSITIHRTSARRFDRPLDFVECSEADMSLCHSSTRAEPDGGQQNEPAAAISGAKRASGRQKMSPSPGFAGRQSM